MGDFPKFGHKLDAMNNIMRKILQISMSNVYVLVNITDYKHG